MDADSLRQRVAERDWYHTIELPGGVTTPGYFDHRPVLASYDLPAVAGRRVLDVGTFDGFFAFEFERRGAAEVVALDVPNLESLDWPAPLRRNPEATTRFQPRHENFTIAQEALGSKITRREFLSVYDVSPERIGVFDVVFVGSVLIHLRDPVGALMALAGVCGGTICIAEQAHGKLDLLSRRVGLAKFQGLSPHLTWWIPNTVAWKQFLEAAGFVDVRIGSTFTIPFRSHRGGVRHVVLTAGVP